MPQISESMQVHKKVTNHPDQNEVYPGKYIIIYQIPCMRT